MATRPAEVHTGTTTSWVPLTTAGPTLSPECASAIYLSPDDPNSIGAFDPWYGQNVDTALQSCQPEQHTIWWDQDSLAKNTLFNLGPMACPNGYTTATTTALDISSTILACCPSGYTWQKNIAPAPHADECFSSLTSGQVIKPMSLQSSGSWVRTTLTITGTGSVIHGVQMNGWNFPSSSTSSSSSPTVASSPSGQNGVSASNTAAAASNTSSSSGLSGGAKAGIGIGVALVAVAVLAAIAFMFMRRRKAASRGAIQHQHHQQEHGSATPPDYYAQSPGAVHQGEVKMVSQEKYTDVHVPRAPVEVSGESRPVAPVEIG